MLVFTRKIGQQVVLPEQGITIDVVELGKGRVRLGITAPADIPVHRREVWDRRDRGRDNGLPASSDVAPGRLATDAPHHPQAPWPSFPDLDRSLAQWIDKRTGGRISDLTVERLDGRIVIRGSARSYHVRQLAQAVVSEVLNASDRLSPPSVEYDIDVAQAYWRSAGHRQDPTELPGGHHY